MTPTPISDELARVVGAEAHASSPATRKGKRGGEWNAWYHLSRRNRRRLIGAGHARKGAMPPDELADLIGRHTGLTDYRDALDWYYRMALAAIPERKRAARNDARARAAKASGQQSYFALRNQRAIEAGYRSFWHQRKARREAQGQLPIPPRTKPTSYMPTTSIAQRREARRRALTRTETATCRPTNPPTDADAHSTRPDSPPCAPGSTPAPTGTGSGSSTSPRACSTGVRYRRSA